MILRDLIILARVDSADVFLVRRIEDEVLRERCRSVELDRNHELFRDRVDSVCRDDIPREHLAGSRRWIVG